MLYATPTVVGQAGNSGITDPYVPRVHNDFDTRLGEALTGDRLIVVVGQSKAGKTRSLFEALRQHLPQARVAVPTPHTLAEFAANGEFARVEETVVVWLENLERFFTGTRPFDPALLAKLTARQARTVVVATLRSETRNRLRADSGELTHDTRVLLQEAAEIRLGPTSDSPEEQALAAATYPGLELGRYGLAEVLAGAPELLRRYDDARDSDPVLYSVVRVAVDWVRIGYPHPIPEPALTELARAAAADLQPHRDVTVAGLRNAIETARTPISGGGRVPALLTQIEPDGSRSYFPFEYLVAADDGQHHPERPIPDDFWHAATADATPAALVEIGSSALLYGRAIEAETLWRRAADADDLAAMYNLGVLRSELRDDEEAERWFRRAAKADHPSAMHTLAVLLIKRGEVKKAERWFRRAAKAEFPRAMYSLANLLEERGEVREAERCLLRAAEADHRDAMHDLAHRLIKKGLGEEAEYWFRRAAGAGDSSAMLGLGALLRHRGATEEADHWDRRADADAVDPDAMSNRGDTRVGPFDTEEAEHSLRPAAEAGEPSAMVNLGVLLRYQGHVDAAEVWFRRAADTGDPPAMVNLGAQLAELGAIEEAEYWFRRAADAGALPAMLHLGALLDERDDLEESQRWYRRAAEAGDPSAMGNLGVLLNERGDVEEAEHWLRRAVEAGSPLAEFNLGLLLAGKRRRGSRNRRSEEPDEGAWRHRWRTQIRLALRKLRLVR